MAFGSIADVLFQWEYLGFFDFVLPFLLIFSIVFGILSYMNIFGNNKGINAIIAVILGLLSIRAGFFSAFVAEIAPRLGVGLTILLAILILIGLFTPEDSKKTVGYVLLGVGAVIFIVILGQLYNIFGYFGSGLGFSSPEVLGWLVMLGLLIAIIVVVAVGNNPKSTPGVGLGPLFNPPPTG